jgi:uncharacterized protein YbcV (DUF1398 family)
MKYSALTPILAEFLAASSRAGVVRDDVDFVTRKVAYCGSKCEEYVEEYPAVKLK